MAKRENLYCRHYHGEDADETLLRQMWRLRLDYLVLNASEEQDWRTFSSLLRRPDTRLITFWDEGGILQGYFTFAFHPVSHGGRSGLLVHSKYYYVRTAFRGHPKITTAAWKLWPGILLRYGLKRMYFVAFSFPSSFVSLSRTFGSVMTLQNADTPEWEKTVLQHYVVDQAMSHWDARAGVIRNQNLPIGEDRPPSRSVAGLRQQYEAMNPEWQQGVSLPIMMRFDWPTIKSVLHNNARRYLRKF